MSKKTAPKMIQGPDAIAAAEKGAALFVLSPQEGWVPAGSVALARARLCEPHALWIYGVAR